MNLKRIARNKHGDDVFKLFEGLGHRVISDDWEVFALQSQFERLKRGKKDGCKLTTYSLLQPSIFEGFKRTIVASACMPDTMFYRLFTARGIDLRPVPESLGRELRYDRHEHGDRITILYASEEVWSKTFRDKTVEDAGTGTCVRLIDQIKGAVRGLFGDEPFLWLGNKDLDDGFSGRAKPSGCRTRPMA